MIDQINVKELKEKLDSKEQLVLIDCREQDEWDSSHIEQAVLVPLSDFKNQIIKLEKNGLISREKPTIIYCRSGKRSQQACENLAHLNYTLVATLTGGILEWQEEGFPVK